MSLILIYIFLLLAGYDYKITTSTLKFEPFDGITSQQCLEIEIIDDSLPEEWEVFALLLSTNNSAVNLTTHRLDVCIRSDDGIYQQHEFSESVCVYMHLVMGTNACIGLASHSQIALKLKFDKVSWHCL